MSGWICSNCRKHFEGGFYNTRKCPNCSSFGKDLLGLSLFLAKLALAVIPVLLVIRFINKPIFDNIVNTARNTANITMAVYYHPAVYFNNIIFNKTDSYFELRENKQGFININPLAYIGGSAPDLILAAGQNVVMKGIIRQGTKIWLAVEFYNHSKRVRCFILTGRDWETGLARTDMDAIMKDAKDKFRSSVLSTIENKEISGKDNIKKFAEENEEYFRLDVEDNYVLKPVLSFFTPQYETAYFIRKTDRQKVDEFRRLYLDQNEIEKKILQIKY